MWQNLSSAAVVIAALRVNTYISISFRILLQQHSSSSVSSTKLLVAAIDFGTTYSGWAFSFKHEYESDPTRISSKQWYGGQHVSLKVYMSHDIDFQQCGI